MKHRAALPAATLLRHVLAGDVASVTCALCLRGESLLPSAQALKLSSGQTITLAQLFNEFVFNRVSEDSSAMKACTHCVDKLIDFHIFMESCQQNRQTLQKLVNILDRETSNASQQFQKNPLSNLNYSYSGFSITVSIDLDDLVAYRPDSYEYTRWNSDTSSKNTLEHQEATHATFDAHLLNQLDYKPNQCKEINLNTEDDVNKENDENAESKSLLGDIIAPRSNRDIEKEIFSCQKCFSDFASVDDWTQHQKVHGKSPHHHCGICEHTFSEFSVLVTHYKHYHPYEHSPKYMADAPKKICPHCNRNFKYQRNLEQHMFQMHSSNENKNISHETTSGWIKTMPESNAKFICEHCGRDYKHRENLVRHFAKKKCYSTKLSECTICNSKFARTHSCRYKCPECSHSPCVHSQYLQMYMKAEKEDPHSKHRCLDCDFVYSKKADLIDHVNKHHLCILPHLCSECGMKLSSKKALGIHITRRHPQTQNCCPYCNSIIAKHILPHHITECMKTKKQFGCELCYIRFETEEKAVLHGKSHISSVFQCDKCDFKCLSRHELRLHLSQCSSNEEKNEPSNKIIFPCHKCDLDFESKEESLAHEVSHPIETRYLCRGCNGVFPTKVERFDCMRSHSLEAKVVCPICGRQFHNQRLPLHMRAHVEKGEMEAPPPKRKRALSKVHMCDICGSLFTTLLNMKKHKDRHKEQEKCPYCSKLIWKRGFRKHVALHENTPKRPRKKLSCTQCNFTTRYEFVYEGHINRVHRQIKPYSCDVCAKTFYSRINLNNHKYSHNDTVHQCDECSQTFRSAKGHQLHMKKHRGDFPYSCEDCDMRFVSASRRNEHRDRVHLGPQLACSVCDVKCYRQSKLKEHIRSVHDNVLIAKRQ